MTRQLFALSALAALALCSCATAPTATKASSPLETPTSVAFDASAAEKTVIELEKKTWTLYRERNAAALKTLAAPGFRALQLGRIVALEDNPENYFDMNDVAISSISFSNWKVTFPIKSTAIVTYTTDSKSTYKGKDSSGVVNITTTWVEVNGEWKQAVYAEAKAQNLLTAPGEKK